MPESIHDGELAVAGSGLITTITRCQCSGRIIRWWSKRMPGAAANRTRLAQHCARFSAKGLFAVFRPTTEQQPAHRRGTRFQKPRAYGIGQRVMIRLIGASSSPSAFRMVAGRSAKSFRARAKGPLVRRSVPSNHPRHAQSHHRLGRQGSDRRLAVITDQLHGLIDQLPAIFQTGFPVGTSQFFPHFFLRFLTHCYIHISGNSDF